MQRNKGLAYLGFMTVMLVAALAGARASHSPEGDRRPVRFVGGYETDRRDGGRPVVLIASALGVPTQVFRDAFSHVHPARGGAPEPGQVHANKRALLDALRRYGITNDMLDSVSDYYRYQPQRGELWRNTPATAYATVENGRVTAITITNPGAGYSSPPTIEVEGVGAVLATVNLAYTRRAETNGSIKSIKL